MRQIRRLAMVAFAVAALCQGNGLGAASTASADTIQLFGRVPVICTAQMEGAAGGALRILTYCNDPAGGAVLLHLAEASKPAIVEIGGRRLRLEAGRPVVVLRTNTPFQNKLTVTVRGTEKGALLTQAIPASTTSPSS